MHNIFILAKNWGGVFSLKHYLDQHRRQMDFKIEKLTELISLESRFIGYLDESGFS